MACCCRFVFTITSLCTPHGQYCIVQIYALCTLYTLCICTSAYILILCFTIVCWRLRHLKHIMELSTDGLRSFRFHPGFNPLHSCTLDSQPRVQGARRSSHQALLTLKYKWACKTFLQRRYANQNNLCRRMRGLSAVGPSQQFYISPFSTDYSVSRSSIGSKNVSTLHTPFKDVFWYLMYIGSVS